jgi:hypothetical protein
MKLKSNWLLHIHSVYISLYFNYYHISLCYKKIFVHAYETWQNRTMNTECEKIRY